MTPQTLYAKESTNKLTNQVINSQNKATRPELIFTNDESKPDDTQIPAKISETTQKSHPDQKIFLDTPLEFRLANSTPRLGHPTLQAKVSAADDTTLAILSTCARAKDCMEAWSPLAMSEGCWQVIVIF